MDGGYSHMSCLQVLLRTRSNVHWLYRMPSGNTQRCADCMKVLFEYIVQVNNFCVTILGSGPVKVGSLPFTVHTTK